ncbi:Smr/MutS family protein [Asaia sp. HN010]|uniref:Smr/MutS family protein n=1 Tax=Asaia sp. HN010 TaxID=3081233 RepID=UPI00301A4E97
MVRRDLSADEESLWQAFARTILPLRGRQIMSPRKRHSRALRGAASGLPTPIPVNSEQEGTTQLTMRVREVIRPAATPSKPVRIQDRLEINGRQPGLDTTSWNALSTGKMRPQRRLDLHGHFAQDAFHKLHHFLHACSAQGIRCVEVITGLGSGQEGGVIRQELPHWLERGDIRPLILAVVHTHKKNKGAVRILLRARNRV